jgi:hypothetical protein
MGIRFSVVTLILGLVRSVMCAGREGDKTCNGYFPRFQADGLA